MDEKRFESSLMSNSNRQNSSYSSMHVPISTNILPTSQIVISNPTITNKKHNFSGKKSVLKVTLCKNVEENVKSDQKNEQVRHRRPRKENLAKFRETIVINDQAHCGDDSMHSKSPIGDKHDLNLDDVMDDSQETVIVFGETDSFSTNNLKTIKKSEIISDHQEQVECPECNKKLKLNSFNAHVKTHLGVKPYACTLCGARFTRRGDVTRHRRLIHETPRNFKCPTCEKYFINAEDLSAHMEFHKTVCSSCGKSFENNQDLQTHMKDHEKKPNLKFKCNVCQYSFGKQIYYDSHIKYVHPDGDSNQPSDSLEQKRSKVHLEGNSAQTKQLNKGKIPMILKNKTKNLPKTTNYVVEQKTENSKVDMVVEKSYSPSADYSADVELGFKEENQVDTLEETQHLQVQPTLSVQPEIIEAKEYLSKDETNQVQYIYKDKSEDVQYIYKDPSNDVQYIYKDYSNNVQYIYKDESDQVQYLYKDDSNDGQENFETDENEQVYMIVDSELESSQDVNESNEESGDAVQTLIDAVQQLIQTHEANNPKQGEVKQEEETSKKPILLQKNNVVERVKIIQSNGGQQIVQIGQHVDLNDFC